jgi:predicted ATPase
MHFVKEQKNDGKKGIWHFAYDQMKTNTDVLNILNTQSSGDTGIYKSSLFDNRFHYLQAERLGPRTSYDMSDYQARRLGQLGTKGEYTAHFLAINQDRDVMKKKS